MDDHFYAIRCIGNRKTALHILCKLHARRESILLQHQSWQQNQQLQLASHYIFRSTPDEHTPKSVSLQKFNFEITIQSTLYGLTKPYLISNRNNQQNWNVSIFEETFTKLNQTLYFNKTETTGLVNYLRFWSKKLSSALFHNLKKW